MTHRTPVTVDDLLEHELCWRGRSVGPAQGLALLVGGLAYTTMALVMFLMTFAYADPLAGVRPPAWACASAADATCSVLLNRQRAMPEPSALTEAAAPALGPAGLHGAVDDGPAAGVGGGDTHGVSKADQAGEIGNFCDLTSSRYTWLEPELSLASEYNLVCGKAWKASLLETLFFAGFMAGNGIFGAVADRHGRRATLAACAAATAVLTALSASPLVPLGSGAAAPAAGGTAGGGGNGGGSGGAVSGGEWGYWVHLVLRCASGVTTAGQALGAYVVATELVGPSWRGAAGLLTQTFYILGEFLLVCLSLAAPRWRPLTYAVAGACGCVALLVPLLPESPRWLLLRGEKERAHAALLWVARLNGCNPPPALEITPTGDIHLLGPALADRPGQAGASCSASGKHDVEQQQTQMVRQGLEASTRDHRVRCGPGDQDCGETEATPLVLCRASSPGFSPSCPGTYAASCSASSPSPLTRATDPGVADPAAAATVNAGSLSKFHSADGISAFPGTGTATATPVNHASATTPVSPTPPPPPPPSSPPPPVSLLTALAHPLTRRLLLSACFVMFSLSVAYFGVTLALGSLVSGSLHADFALLAAAELPGYLALAACTDTLGRKLAIGGGTALAGVALLGCALTPGGPLQVALAMVGKLGCSGAWAVGLTFASELFPTCLRSGALSLASQSGDLGGLVTPALLLLSPASGPLRRLPFAVMGVMALVAVAAVSRLPETRGMPQLDTFPQLLDWLRAQHPPAVAVPAGCQARELVSRASDAFTYAHGRGREGRWRRWFGGQGAPAAADLEESVPLTSSRGEGLGAGGPGPGDSLRPAWLELSGGARAV